jgi:hypothetical protein
VIIIGFSLRIVRNEDNVPELHRIIVVVVVLPVGRVEGFGKKLECISVIESIVVARSDHKDNFAGNDLYMLQHAVVEWSLQIVSEVASKYHHDNILVFLQLLHQARQNMIVPLLLADRRNLPPISND